MEDPTITYTVVLKKSGAGRQQADITLGGHRWCKYADTPAALLHEVAEFFDDLAWKLNDSTVPPGEAGTAPTMTLREWLDET